MACTCSYYIDYNITACLHAASVDELISHGLLALRECLPNDAELTSKVIGFQFFPAIINYCVIMFYKECQHCYSWCKEIIRDT